MKSKALLICMILFIIGTAIASAEDPQGFVPLACNEDLFFDIFSPASIAGIDSSCSDNMLSYPICENNQIVIELVLCKEGCSVNKCNLEFDENNNGKYESQEILKITDLYESHQLKEIIMQSALNHWKNQDDE